MSISIDKTWPKKAVSIEYSKSIEWPKISIVTPSFNQGQFLEETILSILNQHYPNLEYIIIDGGSTDESVSIIERHADKISYWVSEKDRGQSHAINKGIDKCTGEIFNWINSDDYLEPGALKHIAELFLANPEKDLYLTKARKFGHVKEEQIVPREMKPMQIEKFIFNFWYMQPSSYFKLSVLKDIGPLKEELHYCMDTELFIRYFLNYGIDRTISSDFISVNFRMHEMSKSVGSQIKFAQERLAIDTWILKAFGEASRAQEVSKLTQRPDLEKQSIQAKIELNCSCLLKHFNLKWNNWIIDPSKKYLDVAEYAGWYGDIKNLRKYSFSAIKANPKKLINWKYYLSSFK